MDEGRFRTLHALKVKGMTTPAVAAGIVSLPAEEVERRLTELTDEGLVRHRTGGRLEGWSLTKDGKAAHAEALRGAVDERERASLDAAYQRFLPVNGEFKGVCSAWQLRDGPDGAPGAEPNDHSDPAYDATVVERLAAIDARVAPILDDLAVERMAGYRSRLAGALERVRAGERSAFTAPMSESYHDIWMELHEDLILSLGRTRDATDEG